MDKDLLAIRADEVAKAERESVLFSDTSSSQERYLEVARLAERHLREFHPSGYGDFIYLLRATVRSYFRGRDFNNTKRVITNYERIDGLSDECRDEMGWISATMNFVKS